MIGYELVPEEEAKANMRASRCMTASQWIYDAMADLKEQGAGKSVKVTLESEYKQYYSKLAHQYAKRFDMSVTVRQKCGCLWIKYLRVRPKLKGSWSPEKSRAADNILRGLGK